MHVWNMLHAARWKYRTQKKIAKNSPSGHHHHTCRSICSQLRHVSTIGKRLLNSNVLRMSHNMANLLLGFVWTIATRQLLRSVYQFGAPQQISTVFACWLRYCSDVAKRKPTKLCTMFGRLLGWYYRTQWTAEGSVCGAVSPWFFVSVWNISGTAERIWAKFTRKTGLVPRSDEFEGQGQWSKVKVTRDKNGIFGPFGGLRAVCVW